MSLGRNILRSNWHNACRFAAGLALFCSSLSKVAAISFALADATGTSPNDYVVGHEFQVNSRNILRITSLGAFDNDLDGFTGSAIVRLWKGEKDGSWSMVRSIDVQGGILSEGYRYATLAEPFDAGSGLYVVTTYLADRDLDGIGQDAYGEIPGDPPPVLFPQDAADFIQDRLASGGGHWFPDAPLFDGNPHFKAASFIFDAVTLTVPDSSKGTLWILPALLIARSLSRRPHAKGGK